MRSGSSIAPSAWLVPSLSSQLHSGVGGLEQVGQTRAEREAPDRVDVHPHRPQQREPVGLRLRQRAFVGEHVVGARFGQPQRADDAAGVARRALGGAVLHPVRVEAGPVVDERGRPSRVPRRERGRGPLVAVAVLVLVAREDQPDRVARVGGLERGVLVVVDHVVGWSGENPELRARRVAVVADAGEGRKVGQRETPGSGMSFGCTTGDPHAPRSRREDRMTPATEHDGRATPMSRSRRAPACSPTTTRTRP